MNIARLLDVNLIKLRMETQPGGTDSGSEDEEPEEPTARQRRDAKEAVLDELVGILEKSGRIGNRNKLLIDLINRERKATTAIGYGIAIPHVRTMQAKEMIIGVGIAPEGYDFDAPDGEPVRLFFVMAAPPYDDTLYLRVFKALAEVLRFDYFRERLLAAEQEYDIIRAFQEME